MRLLRPLHIAAVLAPMTLCGCSLLFGDVNKSECRDDDDCPEFEICIRRDRCEPGVRAPERDADIEPVPDPDMEKFAPDGDLDAGTDAEMDAMPDPVDRGPQPLDAGPLTARFGEAGDCWEGQQQGAFGPLEPPPGDLHVPQVGCSPAARAWTALDDEGVVRLYWDTDGDLIADGDVRLDGRYALADRYLHVPRYDPIEDAVQVMRVDPLELPVPADARPLRASPFDQRDPVYRAGRTAFVEDRIDDEAVVLVVDVAGQPLELDCGRADVRQWGVAIGPGWLAWFEQPIGSRRTRLVVIDDDLCGARAPRRERLLDGEVPEDVRLLALDDGVAWLAPDPNGGENRVWRWRFAEPGTAPEPVVVGGLRSNPVELAARGHWLAIVGYRPAEEPRYVLDLLDLRTGQRQSARQLGDARGPSLSDTFAVWTEPDIDGRWRVLYERLD